MTANCEECGGKYTCTGFFQRKQQDRNTDCEFFYIDENRIDGVEKQ